MSSPKTNRDYLDRQAAVESNARTYPRRLPIALQRASGVRVTDVDGKPYIDCFAGAGALALGHNHPVVVDALRRHLDAGLPMQTLDFPTPIRDEFVEELLASLPPNFASRAKIQFCGPSGSDAVEAALKLLKTATGRRSILAFAGAYHGQTHGSLAVMGNLGPKSPVAGLMPDVHFLPFPYCYRCPFGATPTDGQCSVACAGIRYIQSILADPECGIPPAAGMILEVVQGEGGSIPASDDWLREIRRLTRDACVPLVLDEVQTAWGRTGSMYAFEPSGIVPDVIVLSKAIGGGLPLAAIVYEESLDAWEAGAHAGTFRGNHMALAAGLATLRFIRTQELTKHAARMGLRLMAHLRTIQADFPFVGDVRGRGLMLAVEMVASECMDQNGRQMGDGARARAVQLECFARGLLVEVAGRHGAVLRFLPPLIMQEDDIDTVAGIFGDACVATAHTDQNGNA